MNKRSRCLLGFLVVLSSSHSTWPGVTGNDTGGPPPCCDDSQEPPATASRFSTADNVPYNDISTLRYGDGFGPTVDISLVHDPSRDWDKYDDGAVSPTRVKHEFRFDLQTNSEEDSNPPCGLNRWELLVDWNRNGTYGTTSPELIDTVEGGKYTLIDRPRVYDSKWNSMSKVAQWDDTKYDWLNETNRRAFGSFTLATPIDDDAVPSGAIDGRGVFPYRLMMGFYKQQSGNCDNSSYGHYIDYGYGYGFLYVPSLSNWESPFGKNWFSNWDRHLEIFPESLKYDWYADATAVVARIDPAAPSNRQVLAFAYETGLPCSSTCNYQWDAIPARRGGAKQWKLVMDKVDLGDGNGSATYLIVFEFGSGTREFYYPEGHSLKGKLHAVKDTFGNKVLLTYDGSGRLSNITNASGAEWDYTYGTDYIDVTYSSPAATSLVSARFHRDSNGRLDYWQGPEEYGTGNHTADYTYGSSASVFTYNRIMTKEERGNPRVDYAYNTDSSSPKYGFLTSVKLNNDANLVTSYDYSWVGDVPSQCRGQKRITATDPLGHTSTYYVMGSGFVWKTESPSDTSTDKLTRETQYFYDYYYNHTTTSDYFAPARHVTSFIPHGTSTTITRPAVRSFFDAHTTVTDELSRRVNQPNSVFTADGKEFRYTSTYNLTTAPSGSELGKVTPYPVLAPPPTVDADWINGTSSEGVKTSLDFSGNNTSGGAWVPNSYSVAHKLTANPAKTSTFLYDAYGHVTSSTGPGHGAGSNAKTWTFCGTGSSSCFPGLVSASKDEEVTGGNQGDTRYYEYDGVGQVVTSGTKNQSGTDVAPKTTYVYDKEHNLTKVTEVGFGGAGNLVTTYEYDAGKRLTQVTDAAARTNQYAYDVLGRMTAEKRCSPLTCTTYYEYLYDYGGRITKRTDAQSVALAYEYDARDRMTRASSCPNGCTSDPHWVETYEYSGDSLLTRLAWDHRIDSAGLNDANELRYTYDYDESDVYHQRGKIIRVATKLQNVSSNPYRHVTYDYQNNGTYGVGKHDRLTKKSIYKTSGWTFSPTAATKEGFDIAYEWEYGQTTDYPFRGDSPGDNIYVVTYPGPVTERLKFQYYEDGLSKTVCEAGSSPPIGCLSSGTSRNISYWANGWLQELEYQRSGTTGLPLALQYGDPSSTVSDGYDNAGNRVKVYETWGSPSTTKTATYAYDSFSRLTQSTTDVGGDRNMSYYYDGVGNATKRTRGSNTTTFSYNYRNELTRAVTGLSTTSYCYDSKGNVTARNAGTSCSATNLWWGYDDRLVKNDLDTGGSATTLANDPLGRRLYERQTNLGTTWQYNFLWDGENPIAKYDKDGNPLEYYVYGRGVDGLIAKWDYAGARRWDYLTDGIYSASRVLDTSGSGAPNLYRFEPFGGKQPSSSSADDQFGFTGREVDRTEGHGVLYYRSRWYDPEIGRFLSRDLWPGDEYTPQSLHKYAYVMNRPTYYRDPWGFGPDNWYGMGSPEFIEWFERVWKQPDPPGVRIPKVEVQEAYKIWLLEKAGTSARKSLDACLRYNDQFFAYLEALFWEPPSRLFLLILPVPPSVQDPSLFNGPDPSIPADCC